MPGSRFFLTLFSTFLLLVTLGIGCRGLSKEEQQAIRPITLNYWTVFGNVDELKRLAGEYKAIRPYVTVNIRQLRYEEFDSVFVNALADDVGPDILSVHTRWLRKYEPRLSKMPATVKVARVETKGQVNPETVVTVETNRMPTADAVRSSYVSSVTEDAMIGKDVYGLPLTFDTLALFYNEDLMDAAGIALPPKTWPEFLEAVKKATKFDRQGNITQVGAALGTGSNVDNAADILSLLMIQNGVTVAEGSRVLFSSGLDGAGSVPEKHPTLEALRFYTDFARPTKDVYTWNGEFDKAIDEFARGKAVFYLGFSFDLARLKARAPQLHIGVAKIPQLNESAPVNVANYWLEAVSNKSKHQNEAWDFVRFLSTPNTVKKYNETNRSLSPLRAHVDAQKENAALGPFAETMLSAKNWYHGKDIDAADAAMKAMITDYLSPYSEEDSRSPLKRDAGIIVRAAQVIQQTY